MVDLPQPGDARETAPYVAVFANGESEGWRRAALLASGDGGATYASIGGTAAPAAIGVTADVLSDAPSEIADRASSVDVQMVNARIVLSDADMAALLGGANLAMIGDEAVQFGNAEPLGGGVWRLSELWRGRRGTEWATGGHVAGEPFVLLEADAIARVPMDAAVGGLKVLAIGVGDAGGTLAAGPGVVGAATRPLAPVGLRATDVGGDIEIGWTRRSREGWRWTNMVDAPVAEERELYRVVKSVVGRADLVVEAAEPLWIYAAAERAADAAAGAMSAAITIVQIGSAGVSKAATISVSTG